MQNLSVPVDSGHPALTNRVDLLENIGGVGFRMKSADLHPDAGLYGRDIHDFTNPISGVLCGLGILTVVLSIYRRWAKFRRGA